MIQGLGSYRMSVILRTYQLCSSLGGVAFHRLPHTAQHSTAQVRRPLPAPWNIPVCTGFSTDSALSYTGTDSDYTMPLHSTQNYSVHISWNQTRRASRLSAGPCSAGAL
jgi:hypothetical protein